MWRCDVSFSFVPVDRFLYVVGGYHKNANTDSVEKYIIEKNQWIKVAPLPCRLRSGMFYMYRLVLYMYVHVHCVCTCT